MSGDRRIEAVDAVRDILQRDPRITGLVLIGSGAVGFRDELSDVDLMAVVEPNSEPLVVGDESIAALRDGLAVSWYLQTAQSRAMGLQSLLLDDHLEVDLSFVPLEWLAATDPRWKVMFDRTGAVELRMAAPVPAVDAAERAQLHYISACAGLYFGMKALRRGERLHAATRADELRAHLTALMALEQFGSDHLAASRADSLSDEARAQLSSLTGAATEVALRRAFRSGLDALRALDTERLDALGAGGYVGLSTWLAAPHVVHL